MRRWLASLLALALAGCPAPRAPAARASRPRLVVLVVIDQLASWSFERDRALFRGGFARLLRDAAYVPRAELPYASSFTAPGHATIGTGVPPSVHGVLGNTWYRRGAHQELPAEYDPAGVPLTVGRSHGGVLVEEDSSSSRALRVDGVADVLRRATGGRARSVAVALKPRAAMYMAGRHPDLAIWYEPPAGGMTTTAAYAPEPPRWLVELARATPGDRFYRETWRPLDPALLARHTGIRDDAPGEAVVHQIGTAFPHELASSDAPWRAVLFTPFADEIVMDAALAAIPALGLGADDVPDLLAIGLNAHDYAGHKWGPDSWEVLDLTLRLDALLGRLFEALDRRLGAGGWAVVLTSDHGVTPVVERSRYPGARRITSKEIAQAIDRALEPRLGPGPWVAKVVSGNIYLAMPGAGAALDVAAAAVRSIPGIAAAGRTDELAGHCESRAGLERAICYSIVDGESGELYVMPAAGSTISDYEGGTHHDAPVDDNRRVPIFVMGPGIAPRTATGTLLQVAPTLAELLGIPPPPAATSPSLLAPR